MTINRSYVCNLCHEMIEPSYPERKAFGIWWCGRTLTFKAVRDVEHHICLSCAKCIHDELRKVTPA